ncbi:hypothetical protein IGI04_024904, partial [Brassica rapa subsp. trilocularis]
IKNQDFLVSELLSRVTKKWNETFIGDLLPDLRDHILSIKPIVLDIHDTYIWPKQKNGLYTAKFGDNLQKIGFILDTICLRSGAPKIVPHILFQCPFAIETWNICPWVHSFSLNQDTDFKTTFQASYKWHNLPLLGFTTNPFLWF